MTNWPLMIGFKVQIPKVFHEFWIQLWFRNCLPSIPEGCSFSLLIPKLVSQMTHTILWTSVEYPPAGFGLHPWRMPVLLGDLQEILNGSIAPLWNRCNGFPRVHHSSWISHLPPKLIVLISSWTVFRVSWIESVLLCWILVFREVSYALLHKLGSLWSLSEWLTWYCLGQRA